MNKQEIIKRIMEEFEEYEEQLNKMTKAHLEEMLNDIENGKMSY